VGATCTLLNQRGKQSVPPRGSGWVQLAHYSINAESSQYHLAVLTSKTGACSDTR